MCAAGLKVRTAPCSPPHRREGAVASLKGQAAQCMLSPGAGKALPLVSKAMRHYKLPYLGQALFPVACAGQTAFQTCTPFMERTLRYRPKPSLPAVLTRRLTVYAPISWE